VLGALDPASAAPLLPEITVFRRTISGASPALDLAIALIRSDDTRVTDLTLQAATWDVEIPRLLDTDGPLFARHLNVLVRLAMAEFAPDRPEDR